MLVRSAIVAASLLLPSAAHAFWEVKNSDEDVFGNVNVTATSIGDNGSMVRFECGSGKTPLVAMLVRDNSGEIEAMPATILMKNEAGDLLETGAVLSAWNDKFVAITTNDIVFLTALADEMISTSKSIPIGATIPGVDFKVSDTFSARGSTAAGNAVKAGCLSDKPES